MIDEKKLIEEIEEEAKKGPILGLSRYIPLRAVKEMVDSQPKSGGWIPCREGLPEEKINPITKEFYEYQVTFQCEDVADIRHYKFGKGHWWNALCIVDEYVTAWQPLPEPYHEA